MTTTDAGSNILIAYFSRRGENYVAGSIRSLERGNAEILAEIVAAETGGTLFEIERATPYPADYHACTDEAQREKGAKARPALGTYLEASALEASDVMVLVYPNWWGTMPMPVYTFLESGDFAGKTILPICTHEGSGLSGTERDIARACPGATVKRGLAIAGSRAPSPETCSQVQAWLRAELR